MAKVPCSLEELEAELIEVVSSVPVFKKKTFSIFALDDMEKLSVEQAGSLPIVGVGYDGAVPKGNQADPKGEQQSGVAILDVQFLVVVAAQYTNMGQSDNKQAIMALLHEVRLKLIGYRGVNTRAWRFMGEKPEPAASMNGLIFYAQVWQTTVPFVGNSLTS